MKWRLSRYWNRMAFAVMKVGRFMIWDCTKKNSDLISDLIDPYAECILTNRERSK